MLSLGDKSMTLRAGSIEEREEWVACLSKTAPVSSRSNAINVSKELGDGGYANAVELRLADGKETGSVVVDALSVASVAEIAEYETEVARWAALRDRFKKGAYAKTVEGAVGVVMEDAATEGWRRVNEVKLRLADGSDTGQGGRAE
eukprot:COSAG06_NODE_1151_length_10496_cov_14.282004_8_plen_146_part_00